MIQNVRGITYIYLLVQLDGLVNIFSYGSVIPCVFVEDISSPIEGQVLSPLLVTFSLLVPVLQVGDLLSQVIPQPGMEESKSILLFGDFKEEQFSKKIEDFPYLAAIRPAAIFSDPDASDPLQTKIFFPESNTNTSPWFNDDQAIGTLVILMYF